MPDTKPDTKYAKFLVCVAPNETSRTAVRLACLKAKLRGGGVDLLYVQEPTGFQPLVDIGEAFNQEQEAKAQEVLTDFAKQAYEESGIQPCMLTRKGKLGKEILAAIREDSDINMLVIGLSPESVEGDKLVKWLAERTGGELLVPFMIVPGNLTDEQLEALT